MYILNHLLMNNIMKSDVQRQIKKTLGISHLEHVELVVLITFEAVCNRCHSVGHFLPETEHCRLIFGQNLAEHVAAAGCQQIYFLHGVKLESIKITLGSFYLCLHLNSIIKIG